LHGTHRKPDENRREADAECIEKYRHIERSAAGKESQGLPRLCQALRLLNRRTMSFEASDDDWGRRWSGTEFGDREVT
jgi:hypothetical protein